jgi:hypothetical protein
MVVRAFLPFLKDQTMTFRNSYLRLFLGGGISILLASACMKKHDVNNATVQNSWFNRTPSSVLALPLTNEKIDVRTYRLDEATETKVSKDVARFDANFLAFRLIAGLSPAEALALSEYTDNTYKLFRMMFEPNGKTNHEIVNRFKATVSALNGMPPFKGAIYFGQTFKGDYVHIGLNPGTDFFHNSFTSASKSRTVALKFADTNNLEGWLGVLFELPESCNGNLIGPYSQFPSEEEVLFRPLHPFRIVSKTPPQGAEKFWVVKLKETIPCPDGSAVTESSTTPLLVVSKPGLNPKIYADSSSTTPVGILPDEPMEPIRPYAKKGSRYEVIIEIRRPERSWECLDTNCLKQKILSAQAPPVTLGGVSGVEVLTAGLNQAVITPAIEMFGQWPTSLMNKTEVSGFLHGFIEIAETKPYP